MNKLINSREDCIRELEMNCEDFWLNDGTEEDLDALEQECNYDYTKVYERMLNLVEAMYSEN